MVTNVGRLSADEYRPSLPPFADAVIRHQQLVGGGDTGIGVQCIVRSDGKETVHVKVCSTHSLGLGQADTRLIQWYQATSLCCRELAPGLCALLSRLQLTAAPPVLTMSLLVLRERAAATS